jgi:hypothetical protein
MGEDALILLPELLDCFRPRPKRNLLLDVSDSVGNTGASIFVEDRLDSSPWPTSVDLVVMALLGRFANNEFRLDDEFLCSEEEADWSRAPEG